MKEMRMMAWIGTFVVIASLLLAGCTSSSTNTNSSTTSEGDTFPNKQVTFLIPQATGGGADSLSRVVAAELEKEWGVSVIVVNRPGGESQIGIDELLKASPDGYTIGLTTNSDIPGLILTGKNVEFTMDSFNFISHVDVSAHMLVSSKASGLKTWDELKDYTLKNPGKLTLAKSGNPPQIDLMKLNENMEFSIINYGSGGERANAVMGGHVDLALLDKKFYDQVLEKGNNVIGIFSEERFKSLPELKTIKEQGSDVVFETFRVIYTSADVPQEIIEKIAKDIEKVTSTKEFEEKLVAMDGTYLFKGPEEVTASMNSIYERMLKIESSK